MKGIRMDLLFTGTGAADWPEEINVSAGKEIRRYSSLLIDGRLLIDCGPHTYDSTLLHGADPALITDIVLTHTHEDHFNREAFRKFNEAPGRQSSVRLHAHGAALKRIGESGERLSVGKSFLSDGYSIVPLEANHRVTGSREKPLQYIISDGVKTLLYATDGAWLLKSAWLAICAVKLDAVVFDATIGETEGERRIFEHNSLPMIRMMTAAMKNKSVLSPGSRIILTHLARTLHPSQKELEDRLLPEGLIPAYDGMRITL